MIGRVSTIFFGNSLPDLMGEARYFGPPGQGRFSGRPRCPNQWTAQFLGVLNFGLTAHGVQCQHSWSPQIPGKGRLVVTPRGPPPVLCLCLGTLNFGLTARGWRTCVSVSPNTRPRPLFRTPWGTHSTLNFGLTVCGCRPPALVLPNTGLGLDS